jgi:hypothetical protein
VGQRRQAKLRCDVFLFCLMHLVVKSNNNCKSVELETIDLHFDVVIITLMTVLHAKHVTT